MTRGHAGSTRGAAACARRPRVKKKTQPRSARSEEVCRSEEMSRSEENYGGFGGGFGDFSDFGFGDIFSTIFGGGAQERPRRNGPMRGDDLTVRVTLTFEEAVFG